MALTKVKGSILSDELYRREHNLSDVLDKAAARTNLDVYSKAETYTKQEVDNLGGFEYKLLSFGTINSANKVTLANPFGTAPVLIQLEMKFQSYGWIIPQQGIVDYEGSVGALVSMNGSDITVATGYFAIAADQYKNLITPYPLGLGDRITSGEFRVHIIKL